MAASRRAVRKALSPAREVDVVGEAPDRHTASESARELQPDVIVVDLGLPELARHAVLTELRSAAPDAHLVVFTGSDRRKQGAGGMEFDGFALADGDMTYLAELLANGARRASNEADLRVDDDAGDIAKARRFVSHFGGQWGYDTLQDEAQLVASELVTNALMHARSACDLRMRCADRVLRIEVVDGGRGMPELRRPGDAVEHGRGLLLVSTLCPAWGVDAYRDGRKMVWAELRRP